MNDEVLNCTTRSVELTANIKMNARRALQLRTREQNREIQKNRKLALPPETASNLFSANSVAHQHALLHLRCGQ